MMTIRLAQGRVAAQATNGVFNDDALAGEGRVLEDVFGRTGLAAGFAARDVAARVEGRESRIA